MNKFMLKTEIGQLDDEDIYDLQELGIQLENVSAECMAEVTYVGELQNVLEVAEYFLQEGALCISIEQFEE